MAATREQLERLVAFAKENGSIIVYDAAYSTYISDPNCPKTIFEIEGTSRAPQGTVRVRCTENKSGRRHAMVHSVGHGASGLRTETLDIAARLRRCICWFCGQR